MSTGGEIRADGGLDRRTLSDQVSTQLMGLIQGGELSPGDFLASEHQLAREFGVSRPVLREALRLVAARGFIEILNGRGAIVRSLAPDPLLAVFQDAVTRQRGSLVELMELGSGIERTRPGSPPSAAPTTRPSGWCAIAADMAEHLDEFDRYNELDLQLHLTIAAASHNAMIGHLMASLHETLRTAISEGFRHRQSPSVLRRTQRLHTTIVDAIGDRDAARARRAMQRHFDDAISAIRTREPIQIVRSSRGSAAP